MKYNVNNIEANETINHVLFECLPTVQVWDLSNVCTNPGRFYMRSVYAKMDYLFTGSHLSLMTINLLGFCVIYGKGCRDKVFDSIDKDPRDILQLAETEAIFWNEAQISMRQTGTQILPSQIREEMKQNSLPRVGRWCFTDKSCDIFLSVGGEDCRTRRIVYVCNLFIRNTMTTRKLW